MAGVIKPLTLRAANKVRRLKNKKAAHTVRPAPTPGPLTLALTFLIHSGGRIKRIIRLRTFNIHPPEPVPPVHTGKHPRMASQREADTSAPSAYYRQRSMWVRFV